MRGRLDSAPVAAVLLVIATFSWAGNHAIARATHAHVPPWSLNFARWLIVAVVMGVVAAPALRRDWRLIIAHAPVLTFLGVIGCGVFGTLQYVGLKYTGALNMGVFNSVAPAFIALASFLIFRDAVGFVQMLGIAISLSGVLAIVTRLDLDNLMSMSFNGGDLILVLNMGLWAIYSACLRLRPPIASTSFLFAMAVPAALVTAPMAAVEYAEGLQLAPDIETIGTVLYAGFITSMLSYICWGRGVATLGVARAGAFLHLVPLFGTLLATTFLGEIFGLHHLIGLALILSGVTLAVRRPAKRAPTRPRTRAKSQLKSRRR